MTLTALTTEVKHSFSQAITTEFFEIVPNIIASISLLMVFYGLAVLARSLIRRTCSRLTRYQPLIDLAARITFLSLLLIGLITALGTAGVNVNAMVASLGLFGFTLGFAFKDLLSNTLAGVMILLYRPFRVGDKIKGKDFDGQVGEINLRYTILANHDHHILIPNATMLNTIVNVYSGPN